MMTSHTIKLVEDLKNGSKKEKTAAAAEIRHLTINSVENRVHIGRCGAITPLLAKENAAATLFSLSVLQVNRKRIGQSNAAIQGLVSLLGKGTFRGKKDAASTLFDLSITHENKTHIVQAKAVKHLVEMLDPDLEMIDKAVALLANLSGVGERRQVIVREGGVLLLVETADTVSQRGKENAASVLLQLCLNSPKFCTLVLQEGVYLRLLPCLSLVHREQKRRHINYSATSGTSEMQG
ncbi:U-box domain-containing protein 3 [Raphanus sativus]|nr:U-box domain-containing protein 3 [Raphanus sativus]